MKREQFLITSTEGHKVIKYKWNSANREVEALIAEIADQECSHWSLIESESQKTGKFHTSGVRVWKRTDGKRISFFITKVI